MGLQTAVTFFVAFAVFAASPGPDNITIFSKSVTGGPSHGIAYGMGVVCSIICFVLATAAGLSAIASVITGDLKLLRYLAAAYLVFTGVTMWRAVPGLEPRPMRGGLVRLFFLGFGLNISNPKMPIFYLALLPAVLGVGPMSWLDLSEVIGLIVLIETIVIGAHVWAARRAKRLLADPSRMRSLNRGAATLMVGAGLLVAAR